MKIITFRFDDGLWEGTLKATKILGPHHASFFIVRDWLENCNLPITDEFNQNKYHGSLDKWKILSNLGHDIQAHSCSHQSFSNLSPDERITELTDSLDLIKKIHGPPYAMCYPYNNITPDNLLDIGYSAGGFLTRTSDQEILYNSLDNLDLFALNSWAVRERHLNKIKTQLENVPDHSWTILAFHSFDNEGYEPWSQKSFAALVNFVKHNKFSVLSLSETLLSLGEKTS